MTPVALFLQLVAAVVIFVYAERRTRGVKFTWNEDTRAARNGFVYALTAAALILILPSSGLSSGLAAFFAVLSFLLVVANLLVVIVLPEDRFRAFNDFILRPLGRKGVPLIRWLRLGTMTVLALSAVSIGIVFALMGGDDNGTTMSPSKPPSVTTTMPTTTESAPPTSLVAPGSSLADPSESASASADQPSTDDCGAPPLLPTNTQQETTILPYDVQQCVAGTWAKWDHPAAVQVIVTAQANGSDNMRYLRFNMNGQDVLIRASHDSVR